MKSDRRSHLPASDPSGPPLPPDERRTTLFRLLTAPLRLLPHYLILGAMKSGTTTLHHMLAEHPEIATPVRKEINYFDCYFRHSPLWYRSHFPFPARPGARRRVTGEASPYYLFHPHAPSRAVRTLPPTRLIVLLRNPVDRAYSHYQHSVRQGVETLSFEEALEAEDGRIEAERVAADPGCYSEAHRRFSYLARGRYEEQIRRWQERAPGWPMLVLQTERLASDRNGGWSRLLEFLDLSPCPAPQIRNRRVGRYPDMAPETRRRLSDYFAPHNERLERLLGQRLDW